MKKLLAVAGAFALLSSSAFAADLVPAPQAAPEMAAVNWSGAYIGANVGYGPGTFGFGEDEGELSFSGLFVGGQIGYNYQLNNGLVFGLEGDLNWSDESGSYSIDGDEGSVNTNLDWFGAVTGHVGYAWDNLMPYVLGGVSFAHNTFSVNEPFCGGPDCNFSVGATHMGYTVGGGLAAMLSSNLSTFVEVRYADYGSANYSGDDEPTGGAATLTDTMVRAGLNFHF
jgi:outer membrane immunogenic protein